MKGVHVVVLITAGSSEEAERLARILVEEGLAACVTVLGPAHSVYMWKGKVEEAEEQVLVAKTRLDMMDRLIKRVREEHSYEVPEIIALPVAAGLEEYLGWIDETLASRRGEGVSRR